MATISESGVRPLATIQSVSDVLNKPTDELAVETSKPKKVYREKFSYYDRHSQDIKLLEYIGKSLLNVLVFLGNIFQLYRVFGKEVEILTSEVSHKIEEKRGDVSTLPEESKLLAEELHEDTQRAILNSLEVEDEGLDAEDEVREIDVATLDVEEDLEDDREALKAASKEFFEEAKGLIVEAEALNELKEVEEVEEDEGFFDDPTEGLSSTQAALKRQNSFESELDRLEEIYSDLDEDLDGIEDEVVDVSDPVETAVKIEELKSPSYLKRAGAFIGGVVTGGVAATIPLGIGKAANYYGVSSAAVAGASSKYLGTASKFALGAGSAYQFKRSIDNTNLKAVMPKVKTKHGSINTPKIMSTALNSCQLLGRIGSGGLEQGAVDYIIEKNKVGIYSTINENVTKPLAKTALGKALTPKSLEEAKVLSSDYAKGNLLATAGYLTYMVGIPLATTAFTFASAHPLMAAGIGVGTFLGYKYMTSPTHKAEKVEQVEEKIFESEEELQGFNSRVHDLLSEKDFQFRNIALVEEYVAFVEADLPGELIYRGLVGNDSFDSEMTERYGESYLKIKDRLLKKYVPIKE